MCISVCALAFVLVCVARIEDGTPDKELVDEFSSEARACFEQAVVFLEGCLFGDVENKQLHIVAQACRAVHAWMDLCALGEVRFTTCFVEAMERHVKSIDSMSIALQSFQSEAPDCDKQWKYKCADFEKVRAALSDTSRRAQCAWDRIFVGLEADLSGVLPSSMALAQRSMMRDAATYETLVNACVKVVESGAYGLANATLDLAKKAESASVLPKKMPSLVQLRLTRSHARVCIGVEWAITKIKKITPSSPEDIPSHAAFIHSKLSLKGFSADVLPAYLSKVLTSMGNLKVPASAVAIVEGAAP